MTVSKCWIESSSRFHAAKAIAVRTEFLICVDKSVSLIQAKPDMTWQYLTCRLLTFFLLRSPNSSSVILSVFRSAYYRKILQIVFFALTLKSSNFIAKYILLWNAPSNMLTRFVIRNTRPEKYFRWRKKTDTNLFRWAFLSERCARYISASSINIITFYLWARDIIFNKLFFKCCASWPRSPAQTCRR